MSDCVSRVPRALVTAARSRRKATSASLYDNLEVDEGATLDDAPRDGAVPHIEPRSVDTAQEKTCPRRCGRRRAR